jgi:uncharacterized protein
MVDSTPKLAPAGITEAVSLLEKRVPNLLAVYLYGSHAKGVVRADSDVDLAVLGDAPVGAPLMWELKGTLEGLVRRTVDLVDLAVAPTVLRAQVVSTGLVVHDGDRARRQEFEARVLSDYARLNEERWEILERVRREGRIHAR